MLQTISPFQFLNSSFDIMMVEKLLYSMFHSFYSQMTTISNIWILSFFCFTKKNIVNSFVVAKLICQVEPLREQHLMKKYCKKLRNTNKRWPTWNVYSRSSLSSDLDFLLMVSIKRVVCINNLIMFAATYSQINNISQLMFNTMNKLRKPPPTKENFPRH